MNLGVLCKVKGIGNCWEHGSKTFPLSKNPPLEFLETYTTSRSEGKKKNNVATNVVKEGKHPKKSAHPRVQRSPRPGGVQSMLGGKELLASRSSTTAALR